MRLHQAGYVCDYERHAFSERHDAQVRFKGRKGIVCYLGLAADILDNSVDLPALGTR